MAGCHEVLSANYGNYQYTDGSVMVWIPAFYMRIGHASNPTYSTYGVNSIDIQPLSAFASEALANASSYYLHRAFVNAGANQLGFFRDKYDCSLTGSNTAGSIALGAPVVSGPSTGQTGFSACTANGQTPANNYGGSIAAAKSRGARFFPESVFIQDCLARISEAHHQASTSPTYCAWWAASGVSAPRGNNNNALADVNDGTVTFTSVGAGVSANFAKAGSGSPFAKTTHNGQACGISDVNGNIYKINIGMTCIATAKTITGATRANPVSLTIAAHGYSTGDIIQVASVGGMTQLNDKMYQVTVTDPNTITLDSVDGASFGAYTSGGTCTKGSWYTLKPSADIAAVTGGNTLATDHWGATGVSALMDQIAPQFRTDYPNNGYWQLHGNGGNAVFSLGSAAARLRAMCGMPESGGLSAAGTNLFGVDFLYQYAQNELCVISRGTWDDGSNAGSRARRLSYTRAYATSSVGFAAASYL